MCNGSNSLVWIIFGYVYILITQIVAAHLATVTQRVKLRILNESKSHILISYSTMMIIVVKLICAIILEGSIDAIAGVFIGLIMISATIILVVTFVPEYDKAVYHSIAPIYGQPVAW